MSFAKALLVAGRIALALTAMLLVVREVDLSWQPIIVLAALSHTLLYTAPLAVLLLALARRWRDTLGAVLALALVLAVEAPLYVKGSVGATGGEVVVMQANLRLGHASPSAIVAEVTRQHVDVLTAEEVTPAERDRLLAAGIGAALPYRLDGAQPNAHGVMMFSRFPIAAGASETGFQLGVLSATVLLPSQAITVVTVHIAAPYPQPSGGWAAETARLRRLLARLPSTQPVVVGGDFNATTDNAQFRALLAGGYREAAEQSGSGYLATYPGDAWYPPLLAIDHVLVRRSDAVQVQTIDLPGSDHRGLVARLRVDSPGQLQSAVAAPQAR